MAKGDMVYLVTSYGHYSGDVVNLKVFTSLVDAQAFADKLQSQCDGDGTSIGVDSFIVE